MTGEDLALFSDVDHTRDSDFFTRYLDATWRAEGQAECREISRRALQLRPGAEVLDAGCGTGSEALELARMVGLSGQVVGVDTSAALIADATRQGALLGLPVTFEVGDARALRFADRSFDAARAERLLVHVANPGRVVSELARVTRRGGRVVLVDVDHDTLAIDAEDRWLTRRIVMAFTDRMRNGLSGRQLGRLARDAGLHYVTVKLRGLRVDFELAGLLLGGHLTAIQQDGLVTPQEVARWWAGVSEANARGRFFASMGVFIAAGTVG